jgi:amidase
VREDDDGDPLVQRRGEHGRVQALVDVGGHLPHGHAAGLGHPGHDVAVGGEVVGGAHQDVAPGPCLGAGDQQLVQVDRRRVAHQHLTRLRPEDAPGQHVAHPGRLADPRRPRADQTLAPLLLDHPGERGGRVPGQPPERVAVEVEQPVGAVVPGAGEARPEAGERVGLVEGLGSTAGQVHGVLSSPCWSSFPSVTRLHDLTALEQAAAVRDGQVSPTELVEHALARIAVLDGRLGAFVTVTPERALAAARRAETALRRGGDLPPLLGVPTAIKDLNNTAGVRTTFGSAVMADSVPTVDDAVVTRLAAAGTISVGKSSTPEFGYPCYTDNDLVGPARCPWDLTRHAGGSSGGAAVAVAAGLVPFAQGSDGGGSIRIPAGINGLFGLKPTRGRVSNAPYGAEVTGFGTNGPLTRSVRDAAAMLDAMAGPVLGDPWWAPPLPPGESFLAAADRLPGRLRIGRFLESAMPGVGLEPEVATAFEDASLLLESLGHAVEDVPAGLLGPEVLPSFERVWALSGTTLPVPPERLGELRPLTRELRARGMAMSAQAAMESLLALRLFARRFLSATAAFDVLLTPVCTMTPRPLDWFDTDGDGAEDFERQKRYAAFTALYNVTGQPAVSVPLHWTADGLPVGTMLVGRPADEATLLTLSAQLESARPWAQRHPAVWEDDT